MYVKWALIQGLGVLCLPWLLLAQETKTVVGKVVQIAGETIYVDVGRLQGLSDAQVIQIVGNGVSLGEVRVVRLADRFSACEVVSLSRTVRVGDAVHGVIVAKELDGRDELNEEENDGSDALDIRVQPVKTASTVSDEVSEIRSIIRGKVAVRYSFLDDQSEQNRDVHQPAFLMDWDVSQIAGTGLRFHVRLRGRRQTSQSSARSPFRLYDLGLHYESANERLTVGVGRLSPTFVSGVGDFDGGLFKVRTGNNMHVGFFGGFQPNWQTSGFDRNAYKMGAFVNWNRTGLRFVRQNTTVAFVGEYQNGQIDREYFYFQNYVWIGRVVSVFQHVAVDLDRTNRFEQSQKVQLRNAYTTLRISPSPHFSMGVGYDARNQVSAPLFNSVEDSLMAVAFRQGVQGDVTLRPVRNVFLYARGNVRLQKGKDRSQAWSVGGSVNNLLNSGFNVRSRYTNVRGSFGQSQDVSAGAARNLGRWFYVDGEWGMYQSVLPLNTEMRQRITGRLQIYLPRRTFLSVEHSVYTGIFKRAQTFLELSTRF